MHYCLTGTYSYGRQESCTVCPADFECVGSQKNACDADKWSSRGDGICKFFEGGLAGYAGTSHDGSGVAQFEECQDGYFSLYGTITCTECPVGHYCPTDRKDMMPLPCEPGDFQDLTGQTSCKSCSSQGYTKHYSLFGATTCHPCPAGYECPATN